METNIVTSNCGIFQRFLASLIDYLSIFAFLLFFVFRYGEVDINGNYVITGVKVFVIPTVWIVYFVVIESAFSATMGHFIVGLKIIKADDTRINFSDAFKRHLADPIDFFFFGLVAFFTIKNTPKKQRIGDIWAHTIVIKDKSEK